MEEPSAQAGGSFCWRLSRFLSLQSQNGRVRIFHRLHPEPIELAKSDWIHFHQSTLGNAAVDNRLQALLISRELLIPNEDADREAIKQSRHQFLERISYPFILYLLTARGCNSNCAYCPVPRYEIALGDAFLKQQHTELAIDEWLQIIKSRSLSQRPHLIILYGGEPLLNAEVVISTVLHLEELRSKRQFIPDNLQIVVATNADSNDFIIGNAVQRTQCCSSSWVGRIDRGAEW